MPTWSRLWRPLTLAEAQAIVCIAKLVWVEARQPMNFRPIPLDAAVPIDLANEASFHLGATEVRPSLLELERGGRAAALERRVMQVLTVLARRPGAVTSRDELVAVCWDGRFVSDDAINRTVAKLRRAAETDAGGDFFIETVPRVGYRLVLNGAPASGIAAAASASWMRRRSRLWWGLGGVPAALLVAALATWMLRTPEAKSLQLASIARLGSNVPAALPATMLEDLRAALGEDNAVLVKAGGADLVLRGSVQHAGDKLRYVVRLEAARDGTMVWSSSRDWPAGGRFTPRQVAVETSQIIRCGLRGAAEYRPGLPTHGLGLLLQQCEARVVIMPRTWERVLTLNRRIVAETPDFARGWSGVAYAALKMVDGTPERPGDNALRGEADSAAAHALRLDDRSAEALTVQAFRLPPAKMVEREALLRRAVGGRLSDCGCEILNYAGFLDRVGRSREANVWFRRAYESQPLFLEEIVAGAVSDTMVGEGERGAQTMARAADIYGDHPFFLLDRAFVESRVGRWDASVDYVNRFSPPAWRPALLAAIEAARSKDPARRAAARPGMLALARQSPGNLSLLPLLIEVGADEAAVEQLRVVTARTHGSVLVVFFPRAQPLIRTPGIEQMIAASVLPDYWGKSHTRPDVCGEPAPPKFCATI